MAEGRRARAFWVAAPGRGEIRTETLAPPRDGQARVRALRSGVSRGTESLVFRGEVPSSQWTVMRCPFQAGEFPAPVKYGYASVGLVEDGPEDLRGRRVFCLHPHQDRYVVPAAALALVPDELPDARAVLAANMETAVNGLWDAALRVGDRVSVVGAGTVGSLAAALAARTPGVEVEIVDPDSARAELAARLGCAYADPGRAARERDLVIHASGSPQGLATALGLAAFEATVLELSWYGARSVALPLGEAFHSRRLQLRSSQVGSVAAAQRARWSHARRMALALRLLADPVFDALLTGESRFEDLPATLARLAHAPRGELCHVVTYP
jgi:threonine dehydrogenase-like Zn-dependent dehydrogenase